MYQPLKEWQAFEQQAFFRGWKLPALYLIKSPGRTQRLDVLAILWQDNLVLIDTKEGLFDDSAPTAADPLVTRFRQQAFTQSRKLLETARKAWDKGVQFCTDAEGNQPLPPVKQLFLIGLQGVAARQVEAEGIERTHLVQPFGRDFYHEEQVLDESSAAVQVFDLGWFIELSQTLNTFPDWLSFLQYHRALIYAEPVVDFRDSQQVLEYWIAQGVPFALAIRQQNQLRQQGLALHQDELLARCEREPTQVFESVVREAQVWHHIVNYYAQFVESVWLKQGQSERHIRLHGVLAGESLVSRAHLSLIIRNLLEQQLQHQDMPPAQLRSYQFPLRHYCLLLYGNAGPTSRAELAPKLGTIIDQIQAKPSPVMMSEVVVVGLYIENRDILNADIAYRQLPPQIMRMVPQPPGAPSIVIGEKTS